MAKEKISFKELNKLLIEHYMCFNSERFWLDVYYPETGFVSVATSSIADTCPYSLCKNIAKFIYRKCKNDKMHFVYIGAWAFPSEKLCAKINV